MSLPKGYKRLEYIESSGTQYVDTKFVPSVSPRIDIDMTVLGNNDVDVFGTATATAPCWILNFDTDNGGAIYYRYYSASYKSYVFASNTLVGRRANYSVGQNLVVDGTACIAMSSYDFSSFKQTVRLFGGRTYAPVRVYSCRIYNGDTLARDFIPCQNASGAVGLWDAVNDEFYGNAGTGTFTAGPVVPEQVDESEIMELEYIESSGTQAINTGFIPNSNMRVTADFELAEDTGAFQYLFSGRTSHTAGDQYALVFTTGSVWRTDFYTSRLEYDTSVVGVGRHTADKNKNVCVLDGVTITNTSATFAGTYALHLFANNNSGVIQEFGNYRLYSCQIYDNGLLERDFVPAMLANGEVGLYDRVFHEFYRNAGTGAFTAGPEMEHDDYTELEYVESNGTQYLDTLFVPNQNTRIDVSAIPLSVADAANASGFIPYGAAASYNSNAFECYTTNGQYEFNYDGQCGFVGSPVVGEKVKILHNKNSVVLETEGSVALSYDFNYQTFAAPYSMTLFGIHRETVPCGLQRILECQIYDNGTKVRIYIPMLHPSGVAGLWDSVNERFYASATTTDFIAGPEAATVPKAPANFRVLSKTDTQVTLAWDPSEKALGYRLYRQGQRLADTEETSVAVTVEPFAGSVFTLTAYNENGEGAGTSLTYYSIPSNPLLYLITDRTQQDVTERNAKGYYAASDLNRVGAAMIYVADKLREGGYSPSVSPKTDWSDLEWLTPSTAMVYLKDLEELRRQFAMMQTTPDVPGGMERFTYQEANNIEKILEDIDFLLTSAAKAWVFSGGVFSGEV